MFSTLPKHSLLATIVRPSSTWQRKVTDVERQRSGAAWFPHASLRELAARLAGAPDSAPGLAAVKDQLPAALARHAALAAQQSELLAQSAPAAMV